MSEAMPKSNPFLQFPYGAIQMECNAWDLPVEGEIPAELFGTLYRNGPNQRFNPRGDYHLFAGDGMLHAFHITEGKVDYVNRWARTAKWNVEDREGRNVINPMNPFDCEPEYSDFVLTDLDGLANTAVLWHGDRLLAIEEGHPPFEMDPLSLDSVGSWTFRGKMTNRMTAHPKVDPETGELVFFSYMASDLFSADVMVHKADPAGNLTESVVIPTPYPAMVHDFVITENYIVIPVMPIVGSLERAMEGAAPFAWEPEKGAHIAILPRHGGTAENVRWLEMDICFAFHFMNAFDKDGVVTVDACQFEHPPLFSTVDGESTGKAEPYLSRWTADLNDADARMTFERIDDVESEFPQCDPRYVGREYRHGWYTSPDGQVAGILSENDNLYNVIGHVDHETGARNRYSCGNAVTSEAIFVPKSDTAAEGEGYLLSVVTSFDTHTSSLFIFDALDVSAGPLAKAHLSHYVPGGFHGGWRPGA